ncbi:MAG: hypothetical protein NWR03_08075, partial [Akkermansiaceae bacterium]|nr:hypothetical protein [Akkermansiaceae bacterium]
ANAKATRSTMRKKRKKAPSLPNIAQQTITKNHRRNPVVFLCWDFLCEALNQFSLFLQGGEEGKSKT